MSNRFLFFILLQLLVVQLTCAQTYQWGHAIGSTASDYANDVFVDDSGYVYLTGAFKGTVDFDPSSGLSNEFSGCLPVCHRRRVQQA